MACTHRSTRCSSARTSPPRSACALPLAAHACGPAKPAPRHPGWVAIDALDARLRAARTRRSLMSVPAEGNQLVNVVVLLGAAVVAVPLFKRLGLGRCWVSGGRPGDRPVRHRLFRSQVHPARRRAGRGDVPVHHRAGDAALAAVEAARRDLRPGCGPGAGLRRAADRGRPAGRAVGAGRVHGGHGLRAVLHRHRHADPGRARRDRQCPGPAHRFHPAARGPGHRAAAGIGRAAGARRHGRARRSLDPGRHRAGLRAGAAGGWPMAAQSAVPPAGRGRARG